MINLDLAPTRGNSDAEGDFDAFISLYGEFAGHFAALEEDYREDFVSRMNNVCDDYDFGEALRDESSDSISDLASSLSFN